MDRCSVSFCWQPCVVTARFTTESGPGPVAHYCRRHYEKLMDEAKEKKIPVIDKREVRRG